MSEAKKTTDHEEIKKWVDEHGGHPARVKGTSKSGAAELLRIDFPGYSGEESLEKISWEDFFKGFDENKLALLFQDEKDSRFNKLVAR